MATSDAVIVLCTAPDLTTARQLAQSALDARLAACITVLPAATSFYIWQGEYQQSSEVQMLLKSDTAHQQALTGMLKAAHPWDVPELLVLPVQDGDPEYLSWLHASLN